MQNNDLTRDHSRQEHLKKKKENHVCFKGAPQLPGKKRRSPKKKKEIKKESCCSIDLPAALFHMLTERIKLQDVKTGHQSTRYAHGEGTERCAVSVPGSLDLGFHHCRRLLFHLQCEKTRGRCPCRQRPRREASACHQTQEGPCRIRTTPIRPGR